MNGVARRCRVHSLRSGGWPLNAMPFVPSRENRAAEGLRVIEVAPVEQARYTLTPARRTRVPVNSADNTCSDRIKRTSVPSTVPTVIRKVVGENSWVPV